MRFSKAILLVAALGMAACEFRLGEEKDDNPVDDLNVMFLGVDANNPEFQPELAQLLGNIAEGSSKFSFRGEVYEGVNTGFGAPFVRALRGNRANPGLPINLDLARASNGDKRCARAKLEKIAYHEANGNKAVPDNFGKITSLGIKMTDDTHWGGQIQLCTWIKNGAVWDEYFWKINLVPGKDGSVKTLNNSGNKDDPFPGTLETDKLLNADMTLEMMSEWDHKLHGRGDAVVIAEAWRNGALLPSNDPAYINDFNCFDFFVDEDGLAMMKEGFLPDQDGYCMGRCDGLIMNTK